MTFKDAMAGGGALLTGAAFFLGAVTERTAAPLDNAYDAVVPSGGVTDESLRICRDPQTEFERTAGIDDLPDILTARLVESGATAYLTWAEGGPNVLIEVVLVGEDIMAADPVSPDLAACMVQRAPTEAKPPFR
jgi:hypothetical protein